MKKDTSYPVANSTYSYRSSGILRGIIFSHWNWGNGQIASIHAKIPIKPPPDQKTDLWLKCGSSPSIVGFITSVFHARIQKFSILVFQLGLSQNWRTCSFHYSTLSWSDPLLQKHFIYELMVFSFSTNTVYSKGFYCSKFSPSDFIFNQKDVLGFSIFLFLKAYC